MLDFRRPPVLLCAAADLAVLAFCGLLSTGSIGLAEMLLAAIPLALAGCGVDRLMERSRQGVAASCLVLPGLLCLLSGWVGPSISRGSPSALAGAALRMGLAPAGEGRRITLSTGAAAWLEMPAAGGPRLGALFLHGAHPGGSRQPAAFQVRRALLEAGLVVLSVDHPGYGASPVPPADADLSAWDPLPTGEAALRALREMNGVEGVIVVGHLMGAIDALRLLAADRTLSGAVLLGPPLGDRHPETGTLGYARFHTDRGMEKRISWRLYRRISRSFYDPEETVARLPAVHPPLLFVTFEEDDESTAAARDRLYASLPGPKVRCPLAGTSDSLNACGRGGIVSGDTRAASLLSSRLGRFIAGLRHERSAESRGGKSLAVERPRVKRRTMPGRGGGGRTGRRTGRRQIVDRRARPAVNCRPFNRWPPDRESSNPISERVSPCRRAAP